MQVYITVYGELHFFFCGTEETLRKPRKREEEDKEDSLKIYKGGC